jgi:hypothetical protein
MRLAKAGLPRKERNTGRSPLYPAQQFQPEAFMHLGEIHSVENPPPAMGENRLCFLLENL